jgi:MFS transporter, SHS family, lactate transporter
MSARSPWAAFMAAWVGWVLDAFDFTIFMVVAPEIAAEFGVSTTAVMGSLTLTLLVRLLGGMAAGVMADRWGRKLPLMLSLVWFATFDGLIALAPSFGWVLVLRTLFGFGMGAEWTAGTTLAMESMPEKQRGLASGILQGSWAVGFLLAALVSALVVPAWGWRALFVVAAVPALVAIPIRMWVPESPAFVAEAAGQGARGERVRLLDVAGLVRTVAWASAVMALGFAVYYGLTTAYPAMLAAEHGMGPGERWKLLALFNGGMLVGAVITGWAARKYGVALAVAVPALAMLPVLPLYVGMAPDWLPLGAWLGGMLGVGFTGVVPMMLTELFPAPVRARCVGVVYHLGAVAAAFVPPAVTGLAAASAELSIGGAILVVAGAAEAALALCMIAQKLSEKATATEVAVGSMITEDLRRSRT